MVSILTLFCGMLQRHWPSVLPLLLLLLVLSSTLQAQYLNKDAGVGPVAPKTVPIPPITKHPSVAEMKAMTLQVLRRPEHKGLLQTLAKHQPVPKGFPDGYTWEMIRTRGWTTGRPYIRTFLLKGNYVSMVVFVPVKVVNKAVVVDTKRDMHACVAIDCPICVPQYDDDSLLIGCATYGTDDAWLKTHPNPQCEHYKRKVQGEILVTEPERVMVPKKQSKKKK